VSGDLRPDRTQSHTGAGLFGKGRAEAMIPVL
jgi:hypothetical protein